MIKDLTIDQLNHIMEFIYLGAASIPEEEASTFKSTLESFRISLDDLGQDEEYDDEEVEDDDAEIDVEEHNQMETESQESENQEITDAEQSEQQHDETDNGENFHERLFELIENDENAKLEDNKTAIKIKTEPEWDETLVKEEPAQTQDLLTEIPQKPSENKTTVKVKQSTPVAVRQTNLRVANVQHIKQSPAPGTPISGIRIRTPASINEKLRINEPVSRTVRIVNKLPLQDQSTPHTATPTTPNKNSIQELSKRLSKAILIRRVRKSDGSVVSERSPIKIVQGSRIQGALPVVTRRSDQSMHPKQSSVFKCSHCNKSFSVNKRRNAHEKFCFKNPSRPPSQCPFCPMVLCNPMYISTHIRKVHGIDENGRSIKT